MPGVDMTSDVKSWVPIFSTCSFFIPFACVIGRAGASKRRRLIMLIFVGWLPPYVRPSGACLDRGPRVCFSLFTPSRVAPHRGCVSSDERSQPRSDGFRAFNGLGLGSQGYLPGHSPYKRTQFPGDGDHHLVGVFPAADQPPLACAQPHWGLPTDLLKRFRAAFPGATGDGG